MPCAARVQQDQQLVEVTVRFREEKQIGISQKTVHATAQSSERFSEAVHWRMEWTDSVELVSNEGT